jgi:hypothetical protein
MWYGWILNVGTAKVLNVGTAALGCPPRTARLLLESGTELGKRHDTQAAALAAEDKTI